MNQFLPEICSRLFRFTICRTSLGRQTPFVTKSGGFTLVEALIALAIFMIVLIPIVSRTFENTRVVKNREKVIAICILDQETALVRASPESIVPVKRRIIAGQEWLVRCTAQGEKLVKCRLAVEKDKREITWTIAYVNKSAD